MKNPILNDLNEKQKEAVLCTEGPVLILAGAGSGKTRTLVHRLAYLIQEKKIPPSSILAVTFTNKAAGEMKQRVQKLIKIPLSSGQPIELNQPWVGTFHSFCVRVLRREISALGYKPGFLIYDEYDQKMLLKEVMRQLNIPGKQYSYHLFLNLISQAKNNLVTPRQYQHRAKGHIEKLTTQVYQEYQNQLKDADALDFDDLIMITVQLFQKYPAVLEKYQRRFQYLLIDEYQDTNHAQYILTKLLAQRYKNICVVGDDWQGIYSFRGADIQNILDFEKDYPNAKVVYLEQNYRSTKNIVEASNKIIAKNKARTEKRLWTDQKSGEKIRIQMVENEEEEGEIILKKIFNLFPKEQDSQAEETIYESEEKGILDTVMELKEAKNKIQGSLIKTSIQAKIKSGEIDLANYVILYRTNAQSRALEEVLLQYGVPYQIIGGVRFYERKEIKDTLAYLRVLLMPDDKISIKRIINEPPRSIGEKSFSILEDYAIKQKISLLQAAQKATSINGLTPRAKQAIVNFAHLMIDLTHKAKSLTPTEIINLVLRKTGYKDYVLDGTKEGETRWENILELKTAARKYNNQMGLDGLSDFLEETALVADVDFLDETKPGLTLMTAHNAKGLEFEVVFLAGMEEGLFPHANSLFDPAELEEERRLCYVGITRAKQKVYLLYTRSRNIWGRNQVTIPSRFLEELPEELVEYK